MVRIEQNRPGNHPEPSDDLSQRELPIITINTVLFRVHRSRYSPLHFGYSGDNRFDAPNQEYGILYLAKDEYCAFRETIGRLTKYRIITNKALEERRLSQIKVKRPLNLVDLTGSGLTHIDADGRLFTGDYNVAQRWSLALWNHPARVDGLYYLSRYDPSRYCMALYDRVEAELIVTVTESFTDDSFRSRLALILETYKYGLLE